jgi:hypothetical protein
MKRGHSNVREHETVEWCKKDKAVTPGVARIPLNGGGTVQTWRELPPLALRVEEWQEIGRRMGWLNECPLARYAACKLGVSQ